jgi:hypothetical protein
LCRDYQPNGSKYFNTLDAGYSMLDTALYSYVILNEAHLAVILNEAQCPVILNEAQRSEESLCFARLRPFASLRVTNNEYQASSIGLSF